MTNDELDAIEAKYELATTAKVIMALVAEVRRLRGDALPWCYTCHCQKQVGSSGVCYECTYP